MALLLKIGLKIKELNPRLENLRKILNRDKNYQATTRVTDEIQLQLYFRLTYFGTTILKEI